MIDCDEFESDIKYFIWEDMDALNLIDVNRTKYLEEFG